MRTFTVIFCLNKNLQGLFSLRMKSRRSQDYELPTTTPLPPPLLWCSALTKASSSKLTVWLADNISFIICTWWLLNVLCVSVHCDALCALWQLVRKTIGTIIQKQILSYWFFTKEDFLEVDTTKWPPCKKCFSLKDLCQFILLLLKNTFTLMFLSD